jgi:uncharacterized protein (DUF4415 family)/uncharacterized DUF497 family protein
VNISFDPAKDVANLAKHGVSLAEAAALEWDTVWSWPDLRRLYGEPRSAGIGYIGLRLHLVCSPTVATCAASSACERPTPERWRDMPKLKAGTLIPTPEEDAAINAGIAADPDTVELTDADLAQLRPLRGRPPLARPKAALTMRVDADVLDALKATGPGWQTRINELLRDAVRRGRV